MLTLEELHPRITPADVPSPLAELYGGLTIDRAAVLGAVVPLPLVVGPPPVPGVQVPATVPTPLPAGGPP